ncbi:MULTISPECIES: DUF3089 domain-containing protein [Sphingomonas]|uniref:DUF3089 domain-containing protein n=1 Tax=Sphingomonas adhaesiva TaxID=28212 RepID=A0A2A4IC29_9SPHN|nr:MULTISPECIES: DUF3089 domain-containing protein [Sphingomonas]PCG16035.1 DUF3089 domain-containing protein [Sphingomonas adhaesiva]PZU74641.1 MAG: DUF3089 domain-containing protein [Sphingomonas sp.]
MVRKFLYVVAGLIVLGIAAAFAYRLWGVEIMRMAMVPGESFKGQRALSAADYRARTMWLARPDLPGNPALWAPAGQQPRRSAGGAAVFFIHPTSYLNRAHWNAPLDDQEANARAALFLRGQASAFNDVGAIWAPRYRQATFGAFLTDRAAAEQALQLAYGDITAAFDQFLEEVGPTRPIILAGHSQGALHLTHLLKDRVAGTALARRIVAAYVVGWPVSTATDLAALGLPACTAPDQAGCVLSWQTFAEPADPTLIQQVYDRSTGFDGRPRRGTPMLCVNPLTGTQGATAPAAANLGTLFPNSDMSTADLRPGQVAARCDSRGLLLIGNAPDVGPYALPGNNYHVYDYSLFWANVRADAGRRYAAATR